MNAHLLRGVALLFILGASAASALTVTQTKTHSFSIQRDGGGFVGVSPGPWLNAPFDPTLGELESVTLSIAATAYVSAYDVNFYYPFNQPAPSFMTMRVGLEVRVMSTNTFQTAFDEDTLGQTTLVPANRGVGLGSALSAMASFTTTNPADLARFQNEGTWGNLGGPPHLTNPMVGVTGTGRYGTMSASGQSETTLTYTYRINDGGTTAFLLLFAVGGCVAARRRCN
jgi:hypothetical protein